MSDEGQPYFEDFGGPEGVLRFIQERSEDIERAVIPQFPTLAITYRGQTVDQMPVGIVFHFIDGTRRMIGPKEAEVVLNDGILSRMKVRIELYRGQGTA